MIEQSVARRTGTSHHRVDERFAALLDSDFGLRPFYSRALLNVPVKQALAVCFWAESKSTDGEERGEMIVRYCRKHKVGRYDERFIDHEPPTYGGRELSGV